MPGRPGKDGLPDKGFAEVTGDSLLKAARPLRPAAAAAAAAAMGPKGNGNEGGNPNNGWVGGGACWGVPDPPLLNGGRGNGRVDESMEFRMGEVDDVGDPPLKLETNCRWVGHIKDTR